MKHWKPEEERKNKKVTVRFTEAEYAEIKNQADSCALSVSSFIRRASLGRRITSKVDIRVMAELRRLGGLLKHVHNESNGAYSAQTAECLRRISAYTNYLIMEYEKKIKAVGGN